MTQHVGHFDRREVDDVVVTRSVVDGGRRVRTGRRVLPSRARAAASVASRSMRSPGTTTASGRRGSLNRSTTPTSASSTAWCSAVRGWTSDSTPIYVRGTPNGRTYVRLPIPVTRLRGDGNRPASGRCRLRSGVRTLLRRGGSHVDHGLVSSEVPHARLAERECTPSFAPKANRSLRTARRSAVATSHVSPVGEDESYPRRLK